MGNETVLAQIKSAESRRASEGRALRGLRVGMGGPLATTRAKTALAEALDASAMDASAAAVGASGNGAWREKSWTPGSFDVLGRTDGAEVTWPAPPSLA